MVGQFQAVLQQRIGQHRSFVDQQIVDALATTDKLVGCNELTAILRQLLQ